MSAFSRLIVYLIPAALILLLVVFSRQHNPAPGLVQSAVAQIPQYEAPQPVRFVEMALSKGLSFEHQRRAKGVNSIVDTYGNGLCVLDFDNDGYEDLFVTAGLGTTRRYGRAHWWNNNGSSLLYRNIEGRYFAPVDLKLKTTRITGFGCTTGDLNGDGFEDIIVGEQGVIHILHVGPEGFDYQKVDLPKPNLWPTSMLVRDINNDGRNDIVLATLVDYRNDLKVGHLDYAYKVETAFGTAEYTGQNTLALLGGKDSYDFKSLPGQPRSLSLAPIDLLTDAKVAPGSFLMVNADGSNSLVQHFDQNKTDDSLSWLSFAAVQITPMAVAGKPHFLINNHGSKGVQLVDAQSHMNQAWSAGFTNDYIDSTQSWANLVADFNNDGLDDVALAGGFATEAMNTPSRPQGAPNFMLLQGSDGRFSDHSASLQPRLLRASRGAVYGDFNNDGFNDLVFLNNNNFISYYQNQTNDNHFLNFVCQPISLCRGSQWHLTLDDGSVLVERFDKVQPYLSKTSARIHFGLGKTRSGNMLSVLLKNGEQFSHNIKNKDAIYRVDLGNRTLSPIIVQQQALESVKVDELFHRIIRTATPQALVDLLSQTQLDSPEQVNRLTVMLGQYRRLMPSLTGSSDHRVVVTLSWLLQQPMRDDSTAEKLLFLILALENRAFVDRVPHLLIDLDSQAFCRLSEGFAYWFEEEEVLPETKLRLLPHILHDGLTGDNRRFACAVEAVAHSEQTTIGASLLKFLGKNSQQDALLIRGLARLKYSKAQEMVDDICQNADDLVLFGECQIARFKLTGKRQKVTSRMATGLKQIYSLHSESPLIRHGREGFNLTEAMKKTIAAGYHRSVVKDHRHLGYQALLAEGHFQLLATTMKAFGKSDIAEFIKKVKHRYPAQVDKFVQRLYVAQDPYTAALIPFVSNDAIDGFAMADLAQIITPELALAIAKRCRTKVCAERLSANTPITRLNYEKLLQLEPIVLYYLIYNADNVAKRVLARQLFLASKDSAFDTGKMYDLLVLNQLYLLLGNASEDWIDGFLAHHFNQGHAISNIFVQQLPVPGEQALNWLGLYNKLKEANGT